MVRVSGAGKGLISSRSTDWPRRALGVILAYSMEAATIILMVVEVVIVAAGVFCRYILGRPIAGSDKIATLVLVWLTFLGGAVAQRRRAHPRVGLFVQHLSPSAMAYVDTTTRLVEVIFFACVCWYSLDLFRLRLGEVSAGAGFDMSLYPLALIIGVTATGLFTVGELAALPPRALLVVLGGAAGLGATAALGMYLTGFQPSGVPATGVLLVGFLVLLAIPLFILAGQLMETGGISRRLVALALVGHLRGGLAHVTVVGEVLFSRISGSTTADVAAVGALLLPAMEQAGYSREEAVSIVSAASAMGILVPPCLLMVILATIADISVTALFLAGLLPAVVLTVALMLLISLKARRQNWPVVAQASWGGLVSALVHAIVPLLLAGGHLRQHLHGRRHRHRIRCPGGGLCVDRRCIPIPGDALAPPPEALP